MAILKPKRGSGLPTGLQQNELAIDILNKRIYLGNTGGTGDIVSSHITSYITSFNGLTGSVTGVASFNSATGAIQGVSTAVAGSGIFVSGATGNVTITNIGVTGIQGGTGIAVSSSTGNPTVRNTGVISINGSTGTIINIAVTNAAQTFTGIHSFSAGLSASGGITFHSPILSTRLSRTSSVVFDTQTGNFSPAEADNGKVFVINITGKTAVTVTLDGLSTGWRAKFLVLGGAGVQFQSSLGTVLGTFGVDGGGVGALTEMVEVYCYGQNTYFAG